MSIAMISATIWLLLWGGLTKTSNWPSWILLKALPFVIGLWCAWELVIIEVSSKVN